MASAILFWEDQPGLSNDPNLLLGLQNIYRLKVVNHTKASLTFLD